MWWDFFKSSIKSEIISFAKSKRTNLSHERVLLVNNLKRLKLRLTSGDSFVVPGITALEIRLKLRILKELEGSKIRSRVDWFQRGEKPKLYFFKLER